MNSALKDTLTVMGAVFIITLILNAFFDIAFFNSNATITYIGFAIVYFLIKYFTRNKVFHNRFILYKYKDWIIYNPVFYCYQSFFKVHQT